MLRMIVSETSAAAPSPPPVDFLGQDDVDPVAREDEAGDAAGGGDGDGDGAHARPERRGKEAALAGRISEPWVTGWPAVISLRTTVPIRLGGSTPPSPWMK